MCFGETRGDGGCDDAADVATLKQYGNDDKNNSKHENNFFIQLCIYVSATQIDYYPNTLAVEDYRFNLSVCVC